MSGMKDTVMKLVRQSSIIATIATCFPLFATTILNFWHVFTLGQFFKFYWGCHNTIGTLIGWHVMEFVILELCAAPFVIMWYLLERR